MYTYTHAYLTPSASAASVAAVPPAPGEVGSPDEFDALHDAHPDPTR